MSKFIAAMFLVVSGMGLTILVMIYGWGLTPVSWSWIIWGGVGHIVVLALSILTKDEK